MRIRLHSAIAVVGLAIGAPAYACGDPGRIPSNLELVVSTELILLGRVVEGTSSIAYGGYVSVEPILAIRGQLPERGFALPDMSIAEPGDELPSDPGDLSQPHPEAWMGGCIRYRFDRGQTVLLFLEQRDGHILPHAAPFTRWAEDVPSADAPWVRAVRIYVGAAALPHGERRAYLESQRAALLAMSDSDAALIAEDIARQLDSLEDLVDERAQGQIHWLRFESESNRLSDAQAEEMAREVDERVAELEEMMEVVAAEMDAEAEALERAGESASPPDR